MVIQSVLAPESVDALLLRRSAIRQSRQVGI
jgi:hypothetical protein